MILIDLTDNNSLLTVQLYNLINLLNLYFKTCTSKGGIDIMAAAYYVSVFILI